MADLAQFQKEGKYLMLALDHRGSFRKFINPDSPQSVTDQEAQTAKKKILQSLIDQTSGVLIDADYGLPVYPKSEKPYLLPIEKSGYRDERGERLTELEYDAAQLKSKGAGGVKLLIYFNPDLQTAAAQLNTAQRVAEDAKQNDLPLFLEIVTYLKEGDQPPAGGGNITLRSLEDFLAAGIKPDVYKLEYPGSQEACGQITSMLEGLPWILLTRGVKFSTFTDQLSDAVRAGARGFLAGRALWQEFFEIDDLQARDDFTQTTMVERFKKISDIALGQ